VNRFTKGDLVRWITGHVSFAAHPESIVGTDPIYKYGIIMQVSTTDPNAIVVHSYGLEADPRLIILDGTIEKVEVLSPGRNTR
jgi:hypothetical protein|tara:strand:+ start:1383 stop:1631 length:249 start_codon:yes stop_codon:yes gene_type:complete